MRRWFRVAEAPETVRLHKIPFEPARLAGQVTSSKGATGPQHVEGVGLGDRLVVAPRRMRGKRTATPDLRRERRRMPSKASSGVTVRTGPNGSTMWRRTKAASCRASRPISRQQTRSKRLQLTAFRIATESLFRKLTNVQ